MSLSLQQKPLLSPALKTRLLRDLRAYADLQKTIEDAKADQEALKEVINAARKEAGLDTLSLEGFTTYETTGGRSKSLDKKKLYALGVTPDELESCYTEKPKKDSITVRCPGEKDE